MSISSKTQSSEVFSPSLEDGDLIAGKYARATSESDQNTEIISHISSEIQQAYWLIGIMWIICASFAFIMLHGSFTQANLPTQLEVGVQDNLAKDLALMGISIVASLFTALIPLGAMWAARDGHYRLKPFAIAGYTLLFAAMSTLVFGDVIDGYIDKIYVPEAMGGESDWFLLLKSVLLIVAYVLIGCFCYMAESTISSRFSHLRRLKEKLLVHQVKLAENQAFIEIYNETLCNIESAKMEKANIDFRNDMDALESHVKGLLLEALQRKLTSLQPPKPIPIEKSTRTLQSERAKALDEYSDSVAQTKTLMTHVDVIVSKTIH